MLNDNVFYKKVLATKEKLNKTIRQIEIVEKQAKDNNIFLSQEYIKEALKSIEQTNISFRNLVQFVFQNSVSGDKNLTVLKEISKDNLDIRAEKTEDGYRISLPLTLPRFDEKRKPIFIEPLNFALKKLNEKSKIERIDRAVFVVINHISEATNPKFIRDNDNYEYKDLINVLAFWFLPDDSFKCCNLYNGTKISDKNQTEIFVVKAESFADFCQKHKQDMF